MGDRAEMNSSSVRWLRAVKTEEAVSHRQNNCVNEVAGDPASAKQLVYSANLCFNSCAEQSHKDSVREAAVKERVCSKTIQPAMGTQLHLHMLLISPALCQQQDTPTSYGSPAPPPCS